jgi:hypothetical protein
MSSANPAKPEPMATNARTAPATRDTTRPAVQPDLPLVGGAPADGEEGWLDVTAVCAGAVPPGVRAGR